MDSERRDPMVEQHPKAQWSALIIDDDPGVRQSLRLCLETEDVRVLGVGTASAGIEALRHGWFDVVFLDLWLGKESGMDAIADLRALQPDAGIVVITAYASFESAVEAMRRGAVDYLPKPFTPDQVRHAARRVVTAGALQRRVTELEQRVHESEGEITFDTASPVQRNFLAHAARAAASESVVLLRGESGSGKSVLARWMTRHSQRDERAFITVHCPMLPAGLMTSVLFGHRAGAFAGANDDVVGKVEAAHGGTLFLDQVGDLSPEAQARLLRFLHDRSYERLGDIDERHADVRVIAATSRFLEDDVATGRFRSDLFYRLNVISLEVPALRQRPEDIVQLARHYLRHYERSQNRPGLSFSASCEQAIASHDWPGNLRELKNAVERAVILSQEPLLEASHLGLGQPNAAATARAAPAEGWLGTDVSLQAIEREHIAGVVARAPSLEAAARILEIDPSTLQRKRKRYGLM